jgi:hypothetical protein
MPRPVSDSLIAEQPFRTSSAVGSCLVPSLSFSLKIDISFLSILLVLLISLALLLKVDC